MELRYLLNHTHSIRWAGQKSEEDSVRNATHCIDILGDSTRVQDVNVKSLNGLVAILKGRGLTPAGVNRKLAALNTMLRVAQTEGHIDSVPTIARQREPEGRTRVLTDAEYSKLLDGMPLAYRGLVSWLADSGMRVSEALRLRWEDIVKQDLTPDGLAAKGEVVTALVRNTKGGRPRAIPLTARLRNLVAVRHDGFGPFTRLSQSSFNKAWKQAREEAGLGDDKEVVPHILRHTCASRLLSKGASLPVIKQWLGHANIQTTMRYAHLDTRSMQAAMSLLD